jgi:hypothetical protein
MSYEQLTFQLSAPSGDILGQIQKLAQQYGGQMQGDAQAGQVSFKTPVGLIQSDYVIDADKLILTITEKPFLVGYDLIKKTIKDNVAGLA